MDATGKSHEPSVDASDRESRVQARRNRIESRIASKDSETRKNKQLVGEAMRMGRGQQQVADSLNQLDRRKLASIQHVTSVRVQADDVENKRRIAEEERRHARLAQLQQEAIASGAQNAAVEMRWSDLFDYTMPQELHRELVAQSSACAAILASKDAVIRAFQLELKRKDEEYVAALQTQADDVEQLLTRMGAQYRTLQDEYERELEVMEDAFLKERDDGLAANKSEIDALFERRRETEMVYMETKQARDEQYGREIDALRVRDAEDYTELKIKLETTIQTLEQQLEEMRATYQLNTEKLEYNYRVLTERDMENSATLSQQKRKLARLKDALSALVAKYTQTDARDKNQNAMVTDEYRRLTKQYRDLQHKVAHFDARDKATYDDVRAMHESEAAAKVDKLLAADRVIHEQQLGLGWRAPAKSIRDWGDHVGGTTKHSSDSSATTGTVAAVGSSTNNNSSGGEPLSRNAEPNNNSSSSSENVDDAFSDDVDAPVERKISSAKLKYMLQLLASEAGFLVSSSSVQQALASLPDDEAELVKADLIMRALGVDNEADMERLMGYFFQDPRAEVPIEYSSSATGTGTSTTLQQAPTPKWGLIVGPEDVIRVIKQFVDEMNEQKRLAPLARMLRRANNPTGADDMQHKKHTGGGASGSGSSSAQGANVPSAAALKARLQREYWTSVVKVIPPKTVRVMEALEKGLTMYHHALLRRKESIDDVSALKRQNAELKTLLKQYLGAPINEDLIVPPTQMQMYQ